MLRTRQNIGHQSFFHNLAVRHHANTIRNCLHNAEIMRDKQHRHAGPLLHLFQKPQNLRLNSHIERRRRLVGNQQIRLVGKRHGDHHPLPLPSRELVRERLKP